VNSRSTNNRNVAPATSQAPVQNAVVAANPKLMSSFAAQYGIDANKMMGILRSTAFSTGKDRDGKPNPPATDDEIAALIAIAHEYHLNPFLKEIYAFRNRNGGITPIVGFDGWIRLVQAQPMFDGEEFLQGYDHELHTDEKQKGTYYECTMWRKDRSRPSKVREYLRENWRNTDPWNDMPNRMLRMRSYIQCARICFGFGGIYDWDEGERAANATDITPREVITKPATRAPRELPRQRPDAIEHQAQETTTFQPIGEVETVNLATGEIKPETSRKSLASEPPDFGDEEEAGVRG
jgi:phage recombination protein Bet